MGRCGDEAWASASASNLKEHETCIITVSPRGGQKGGQAAMPGGPGIILSNMHPIGRYRGFGWVGCIV